MDDLGDTRCFSEKHLNISKVNGSAISTVHDRSPFVETPIYKDPQSLELPRSFQEPSVLQCSIQMGWWGVSTLSWKFSDVVTTVLSNPLTVSRLRCGCEIAQTNAKNPPAPKVLGRDLPDGTRKRLQVYLGGGIFRPKPPVFDRS